MAPTYQQFLVLNCFIALSSNVMGTYIWSFQVNHCFNNNRNIKRKPFKCLGINREVYFSGSCIVLAPPPLLLEGEPPGLACPWITPPGPLHRARPEGGPNSRDHVRFREPQRQLQPPSSARSRGCQLKLGPGWLSLRAAPELHPSRRGAAVVGRGAERALPAGSCCESPHRSPLPSSLTRRRPVGEVLLPALVRDEATPLCKEETQGSAPAGCSASAVNLCSAPRVPRREGWGGGGRGPGWTASFPALGVQPPAGPSVLPAHCPRLAAPCRAPCPRACGVLLARCLHLLHPARALPAPCPCPARALPAAANGFWSSGPVQGSLRCFPGYSGVFQYGKSQQCSSSEWKGSNNLRVFLFHCQPPPAPFLWRRPGWPRLFKGTHSILFFPHTSIP